MILINKVVCRHEITSRHWLVTWDCFTEISIKICPSKILKRFSFIAGCTRSNPIYSLGETSFTQIYEVPDKGTQFEAWQGNLTAMASPKWCQRVQYPLTNNTDIWAPGNAAHHLTSFLVTLPTRGNTCYIMEFHNLMAAFFHPWIDSLQHWWHMTLHIPHQKWSSTF